MMSADGHFNISSGVIKDPIFLYYLYLYLNVSSVAV